VGFRALLSVAQPQLHVGTEFYVSLGLLKGENSVATIQPCNPSNFRFWGYCNGVLASRSDIVLRRKEKVLGNKVRISNMGFLWVLWVSIV
jgi:hypothetical protein